MSIIPLQAQTDIKAALTKRHDLIASSKDYNPIMDINSLRVILKVDMDELFKEWLVNKK